VKKFISGPTPDSPLVPACRRGSPADALDGTKGSAVASASERAIATVRRAGLSIFGRPTCGASTSRICSRLSPSRPRRCCWKRSRTRTRLLPESPHSTGRPATLRRHGECSFLTATTLPGGFALSRGGLVEEGAGPHGFCCGIASSYWAARHLTPAWRRVPFR